MGGKGHNKPTQWAKAWSRLKIRWRKGTPLERVLMSENVSYQLYEFSSDCSIK